MIEILDKRLIYFNPGRVLNQKALMSYVDIVQAMPEVQQGLYDVFSDHSQIEKVELTSRDYMEWATDCQKGAMGHQPYKAVLYSSTMLGFGMARMFESVFTIDEVPVQLKVFGDLEEALEWLRLPGLKQKILSLGKRAAIPLTVAGEEGVS